MPIGPDMIPPVPVPRAPADAVPRSLANTMLATTPLAPASSAGSFVSGAGSVDAGSGDVEVVRPVPLPPAPDDRFQASRALLTGLRESRAMAALAADLVLRLADVAEADPAAADTLRTRLREVIEIGSARDTDGPLAALYAAARRDPALPLARILSPGGALPAGAAPLAEAARELRALDERFAARDYVLSGFTPPAPAQPSAAARQAGLDLLA